MDLGEDGERDALGCDRTDVETDGPAQTRAQRLGRVSKLRGDAPSAVRGAEQPYVIRNARCGKHPQIGDVRCEVVTHDDRSVAPLERDATAKVACVRMLNQCAGEALAASKGRTMVDDGYTPAKLEGRCGQRHRIRARAANQHVRGRGHVLHEGAQRATAHLVAEGKRGILGKRALRGRAQRGRLQSRHVPGSERHAARVMHHQQRMGTTGGIRVGGCAKRVARVSAGVRGFEQHPHRALATGAEPEEQVIRSAHVVVEDARRAARAHRARVLREISLQTPAAQQTYMGFIGEQEHARSGLAVGRSGGRHHGRENRAGHRRLPQQQLEARVEPHCQTPAIHDASWQTRRLNAKRGHVAIGVRCAQDRSMSVTRRAVLLGCLAGAATVSRALAPAGRTRTAGNWIAERVAPGIHVRRGLDEDASMANADAIANIGFIVGRTAVAVFDPGGSLNDGRRLRAQIRTVTSLPIRYVIMSHGHPDHVFGAAAFEEDRPEYVGHARLPAALQQRGEFYRQGLEALLGREAAGAVVMPTRLVEGSDQLDLGDRTLRLTAHPVAHSDCDLSVYDAETATLLAGDLVFVERIPSLDGRLTGWQETLARLQALPAVRVVPGHGPVSVNWPSGAASLERYLGVLLRETRAAFKRGVDLNGAVATVGSSERGRWKLFDDYHGHNVTQAFKEVEWE